MNRSKVLGAVVVSLGATVIAFSAVNPAPRLQIDEQRVTMRQPIRGGDGHDDAVPLDPGTPYHLDHHQREDEFDYFYVEAASGQKIVATVESYELGVAIGEDRTEEIVGPNYSCAGIGVDAPDGREIIYDHQILPRERTRLQVPLADGMDGRYYVRVGPRTCNQHMNSPFRVELVDMFDAGSGRDAGSREDAAVEIRPGREYTGYLYRNDGADMFRFRAAAGARFAIRARPMEQSKMELQVVDGDGVHLARNYAPNMGAVVRIDSVVAPRDGELFVKVGAFHPDANAETPYSLEITAPAGAAEEGTAAPDVAAEEEEGDVADVETADRGATPTEGGSGGLSPVLILLALMVVAAALAGGVVLGRRTR